MRVLLGHAGLRGDLVCQIPAITYLHDAFGFDIDMPVHRRFADMTPLFLNHSALRSVVITDGYADFPTSKDNETLAKRHYDRVYNPMQPHVVDDWFRHGLHQVDLVLMDYLGLRLPPEYRQIRLTPWFGDRPKPGVSKVIGFAPFAGFESNPVNDKTLSVGLAQQIVDYLVGLGYTVVQLSGPGEPTLTGATACARSYCQSVKDMVTEYTAVIHTDTGAGWFASAYQVPQLGLYAHRYYGKEYVKAIQPINPNGLFVDQPTMADYTIDMLRPIIDTLLLS